MPLKLDNESELREAQAALFNINSKSGWVLLNYVGPSTVHFAAGGEGGLDDLLPQLEDDQIQYVLLRLGDVNGWIGTGTTLDLCLIWIGPGVGIIEKGKKTALQGDAENYLQPFQSMVTVLRRANCTRDRLIERSDPRVGSHVID
jgi:hypothetical protein